jgi:nitrate reductase gamma subunit
MIEASREVFWGIPQLLRTLFYFAAVLAFAIFLIGSWFKVSVWLKGRDDPFDNVYQKSVFGLIMMSLRYFFSRDCLLAQRVMARSKPRGIMLIFVYWGFIILFIGTLMVAVDYDLGLDILKGRFYLYFSLVLDIAGGLAFISLLFYIFRRYLFFSNEVVSSWDDAVVLILLFMIVLSGFCIEGIRFARFNPPLMDWSPIGAMFSLFFKTVTDDHSSLQLLYRIFWVFHGLCAFTFIAYIPFSKQFHMFASQITTMEASMRETNLKGFVHE